MTMQCSTLLLPPSSIPPYRPPLAVSLPAPPPVLSVDSRRLLATTARRKETAALRQRWRQHQQQQTAIKPMTSRFRHPQSAPPQLAASPDRTLVDLRKRLVAYGYGKSEESDVPYTEPSRQFPHLEREVTKRNLTQRLPYHVKLEVEGKAPMNFPTTHPSYPSTLFLPAWGARKPSSPTLALTPRARCLRSQREERFFIHPEWSSEKVEWQRFVHDSNPTRFRFSWM